MKEYQSNSRLSKKENNDTVKKEKVEKIIKGDVKIKKRNTFLRMFLSDDVSDIKDYVIGEVLIPSIKNAIEDIVTNGISMILRGETTKSRRSSASRISYRSYYEREDRERDRERNRERSRTACSYDDIILTSRVEAEEVISKLDELIDVYGVASVGDLYDLVGLSSSNYTINNYGWTSVRSATAVRVRDGYLLKLPRVQPL